MKKILLYILLFSSFTPMFSQPWAGGEVSWECLSNGKYRFIFRYYVHCGMANPGQTVTLSSNSPAGNISLFRTSIEEITPVCNVDPSFIHLNCATAVGGLYNGEMKIHTFTSDQYYPNGVQLTGIIPATGWHFYYSSSCRYEATNITNAGSSSYCFYAKMYPYNNQNATPCYDNSPVFAEKPVPVFSSGIPVTLNNGVTDVDNDTWITEWSPPYQGMNQPISNYASGYAYWHPFNTNPNNYESLDSLTGDIYIPSPNAGSYIVAVKAKSYRNGQLIAEIFREFHYEVKTFGTNSAPVISPPFYDAASNSYSFIDTIVIGDQVSFPVSVYDFQYLPNNFPQTVTLNFDSTQFGSGYTNVASGCPVPPCPTLTNAVPVSGTFGVQTTFNWQTACDHLRVADSSGYYEQKLFNFYARYRDDFCPATATNIKAISILVKGYPVLQSPEVNCITVFPGGNIYITWKSVQNSLNSFNHYEIYSSLLPGGPYTLLDSIENINQTGYTDTMHNGQTGPVYYYVKTLSGCNGDKSANDYDTLSSIFLQTQLLPNKDIELTWNPLTDSLPLGSNGYYHIYRRFSNTGWNHIDSTQNLHYCDNSIYVNDMVFYMVSIGNPANCISISSISSLPYISRDAGVIEIIEPDSTAAVNNVKLAIKNFGYKAIDTLPISYEVQGGTGATEVWTGQLPGGDTLIYDFQSMPVLPTVLYTICASTHLINDASSSNDSLCKIIDPVVGLNRNELNEFRLLYINQEPGNARIRLAYYLPGSGKLELGIYNTNGKVIRSFSYYGSQGKNELKIPVPELGAGLYMLKVQFGDTVAVGKFFIAGKDR